MREKKELYPLFGIVTVLNTPFTASNAIDYHGLKRNIQYALKAEVAGFFVPGMAAEVHQLSPKERYRLVELVLTEVAGRVPVIVGTSDPDFNQSKNILKQYLALGCTHVLFQIPYENDQDFTDKFKTLADQGPDVIMLQDWDFGGYGLSDQLIVELFNQVPAFRCLKVETVPAGVKYSNILEKTEGRLNVSGGWAVTQMIEALDRGVHAFMPTGMHYVYTEIYRQYQAGNLEQAIVWFEKLLPILAFSNQHLDISIYFFKKLLHQQGYYVTDAVRPPRLTFDNFHEQQAQRLIDRVMKMEGEIENYR